MFNTGLVMEDEATTELAAVLLRHDLRQPLAAMTILVDELSTAADLPPHMETTVRMIRQSTTWMHRLLQVSGGDDTSQVIDLAEAVRGACTAQPVGESYEVRLVRLDRSPVLVDPVGLERATRNLVDNATRAVADGGTVEVAVRADEDSCLLEVADSGPGFGKLAPVHGHGLVGVRGFASRCGGALTCGVSDLGGALVTLRLPLALGW